DPLATGVLVLLLGRATRLVQFYSGRRKRYTAGFRFGFATDTYDSDGEAQGTDAPPALEASTLERLAGECVRRFPRKKSEAAPRMNWRAKSSLWNSNRSRSSCSNTN